MVHCIDIGTAFEEAILDLRSPRERAQVKGSETSASGEEAPLDPCNLREGAQLKGSQTSASLEEAPWTLLTCERGLKSRAVRPLHPFRNPREGPQVEGSQTSASAFTTAITTLSAVP